MNISYVIYTAKFAKISGQGHVYTKKIGENVVVIDFKEYFNAMCKSEEKYNEYYAYQFSTFSITEEQYSKL